MSQPIFKAHMEILPLAQQCLWSALYATRKLGLVLYGGTAIALRLGHRSSVDFDFFTNKPLDPDILKDALPFISKATVLQDQRNTFTILVPGKDIDGESVKISFFGEIGIGRVGIPEITSDGVLQVASLNDLMATKVKVILQRVEVKDYQDIAAMIKAGVSLSTGLAAAREMYHPNFQPSESLKAMAYFEGGDLQMLSEREKNILIKAVKSVGNLPSFKILSRELAF